MGFFNKHSQTNDGDAAYYYDEFQPAYDQTESVEMSVQLPVEPTAYELARAEVAQEPEPAPEKVATKVPTPKPAARQHLIADVIAPWDMQAEIVEEPVEAPAQAQTVYSAEVNMPASVGVAPAY